MISMTRARSFGVLSGSSCAASLPAALLVLNSYALLMIEEGREEAPQKSGGTSTTPDDMAKALDAARASSPSLGAALDAAKIAPDELAGAHGRATSDEHGAAEPALDEENERG
jgi:hypothetical protein